MALSLVFRKAKYGRWLDKVIDLFTGRLGYSHVELVFSDGKAFSASPQDMGTRFAVIDFKKGEWDWVSAPVSEEEEAIIRAFCERQDGKGYDWLGAIGVVLPVSEEKSRWFCTEVIMRAFQEVAIMSPLKPHKFSPNSFSVIAKRPGIWARYW